MITKKEIGWINGTWSSPKQLKIPIRDRGLSLSDGIFETIAIFNGEPQLFSNHLKRWQRSAALLQMAKPPEENWLKSIIQEAMNRIKLNRGNGILRLNWSRGITANRGINILQKDKSFANHNFWLELYTGEPDFTPISTIISRSEKRNSHSLISRLKTFNYAQSIIARQEANLAGFDDAILLNTNNALCCGTAANIIIRRKDELLTPPLSSGCLPGIMRAQGIKLGLIKEVSLNSKPEKDDEWLLINSLSCHPIHKINTCVTRRYQDPKALWLSLITKS